ncbi:ATP-binding cassette domain-containing protein [Rhodothermus profundi]|uniref:ABC transporter domain-containing protein n=1 Tax=Rhodothermus profundi TaxID=633813 RepID=A0A1M6T1K0_9BACT|nr:ATP-binding cassette domain-containing protein [Rhodothermus profundi]SHK50668.1 hypothetical protein SAMN04488087_1316 [Rhodothermus profundi]
MRGRIASIELARPTYRYLAFVEVKSDVGDTFRLPMTGTVAQWLRVGQRVHLSTEKAQPGFDAYRLRTARVVVWPLFEKVYTLERRSLFSDRVLYRYRLRAREARYERDYAAIVELEQYHYASRARVLAHWYCEQCGIYRMANARPDCPAGHGPMRFYDLKDATRASRFLVLELLDRQPYEPEVVGYVRIDPPLPLLHRRRPDGSLDQDIRRRIFPPDWFDHPFQPDPDVPPEAWWEEQGKELARTRSPVARLARVVVHPDYRADGLGVQAIRCMVDWVRTRWIPDMRLPKRAIETVAQMARFHPFLEKAGFFFLFETGSGRPALYLPLDETARQAITHFLQADRLARAHGGRLYQARFTPVEPLNGPIVLHQVTKIYRSQLNLEGLAAPVRAALEAFGVEARDLETYVFRRVNLRLEPGTVNVVVGASGSGKTTLLRLLIGAATGRTEPLYRTDEGEIQMPGNVRLQALIPGEVEPALGRQPVLEALYQITGDAALAIEVLNVAGLADAVLFRAPYAELSTGQKARVQLAWALAHRPNLLLIDEFAAHLDPRTAARVGRKLAELARRYGITLVLVTHRPELLQVLEPDAIYLVGYGTLFRADELPELGLFIKEPYASLLVEGKKTWEIRKHPTRVRGRIGIVSGGKLIGTAELRETRGPFSVETLAAHADKHLADTETLNAYARGRPLYAWVMEHARRMEQPVPVPRRPGHQMWIRLRPQDKGSQKTLRQEDKAATSTETSLGRQR